MSYRTCCCTGYLTNPGGRCCMEPSQWTYPASAPNPPTTTTNTTWAWPQPIDWDRLREVVREEIAAAKDEAL